MAAAVLLAYIPRLPSSHAAAGLGLASGSLRITPGTNRRLRVFAMTQIACSFLLLAGASALIAALLALQRTDTGLNLRQVLAFDVPLPLGSSSSAVDFYQQAADRIATLPGVERAAGGNFVPWRDTGHLLAVVPFAVDGYTPEDGETQPHARLRNVTPGFFASLGVPLVAGRDFTTDDRRGSELVVIVSQSLADRVFPGGQALNRHFWWTDSILGPPVPRRIIGIAADVDDEHVVPGPMLTAYHPLPQMPGGGRLFVRTAGDPYALVPAVTRIIRDLNPDQPVARPATLEDVRSEVLTPERLNAFVVSGFAGIALLIAVVGVAGVLAFSVSARTREFGVRLAVGSTPRELLLGVLREGASIVAVGVAVGAVGALVFAQIGGRYLGDLRLTGTAPVVSAAAVLLAAAVLASLIPAARAARVDVIQALRSE
jgi:predicted permease